MYSIWAHRINRSPLKLAHCGVRGLFKTIKKIQSSLKTSCLEIALTGETPQGNKMPDCPTDHCANCPRAIKKTCPVYKIFTKHAKDLTQRADK